MSAPEPSLESPRCLPFGKAINCLPSSETDKSVQLVRLGSLTAESKMPTLALELAMESYFGIKVMAQCTVMGSAAYKELPTNE